MSIVIYEMGMGVSPSTNPEQASGSAAMRRSERVLVQIPIIVAGKDVKGRDFHEESRTIVINRNGARIILAAEVRQSDRLKIKNLQNQLTCPFRVVARMLKSMSGLQEWGVECLSPETNFWGILFPDTTAPRPKEEAVDALLECGTCKSRELARLPLADYRALVESANTERFCAHCNQMRKWEFGFVEEVVKTATPGASVPGIERRRAKRLTVKLPMRLRLESGREEITKTENLSKTGLCFYSSMELSQGETIRLAVGITPDLPETEVSARVVWQRSAGGREHYLYGVRLLDAD